MTFEYQIRELHQPEPDDPEGQPYWFTVTTPQGRRDAESRVKELNDFYEKYGRRFAIFTREVSQWKKLDV